MASQLSKFFNRILTRQLVVPLVMARGRLGLGKSLLSVSQFYEMAPNLQEETRLERLRELIRYATQHSPFYRDRFAAAGVNADQLKSLADLSTFPFLTKSDLVGDSYRELLTGDANNSESIQTAGTTGLPVTVLKSRTSHAKQIINRIHSFASVGTSYGDREARFWGRAAEPVPRSLRDKLLNRQVFAFLGQTKAEQIAEAEALLQFSPDYFYGYSSLVLRAARIWQENQLPLPKLSNIICTAESLLPHQIRQISETFGCPVIMEYGCSEVDIIATQCHAGTYHVLDHHLIIETDPAGTHSGEAVLTDLSNFMMPLIRYRLGDDIRLCQEPCSCGSSATAIEAIDGRTLTQLINLPSGRLVHAVVFAHLFEALSNEGIPIHQFRVRQTKVDHFVAQVELNGDTSVVELTDEIRRRTIDGLEEEVIVETVVEPVVTLPGEKFTYFVPLAK